LNLLQHTYIATVKEQVELFSNQLGDKQRIIVEQERRDTFPAIALAITYLYSVDKIDPHEVICVLPVDPLAEEAFFYAILDLEQVLLDSSANIALLGVRPTSPSEKYGYILSAPSSATQAHSY